MKLRMFSVVGESLHFGARRMETIMRVAWLPVVLLLILNMATVMALLSVAFGRVITFADAQTWAAFEAAFNKVMMQVGQAIAQQGPLSLRHEIYVIFGVSIVLQLILVASFMAPLIRYAGLGERPAGGVVRISFGPDQIRYVTAGLANFAAMSFLVFAPIAATAYYVWKYLKAAMDQTFASFPNPESLHTIELIPARDILAKRGELWLYDIGVPLIAAAPFALLFWIILIAHFHPRNRSPEAGAPNLAARGLWTLAVLGAVGALPFFLFGKTAPPPNVLPLAIPTYFALYCLAALYISYFNVRLAPYPGIAVCRKSLAPAGLLRVTRGWNLMRLVGIMLMIGIILSVMDFAINTYLFTFVAMVTNFLYAATGTATKLVSSGVQADWVRPFFVWTWNIVKILVNIFWTFFSYGVAAGYLGRLYRESERGDGEPVSPAPWRRA